MNIKMNYPAIMAALAIMFFSNTASAQKSEQVKNTSPINNSLSYVTRLEPITYEYNKSEAKATKLPSGLMYGFNAEELQQVLPGIVKTRYKMIPAGKNNFKTVATQEVDLESLIPLLVGSIKEQQTEIEKLKTEMQSLKRQANNK